MINKPYPLMSEIESINELGIKGKILWTGFIIPEKKGIFKRILEWFKRGRT